MGKKDCGRGNSSSARGRGQNRSSRHIQKSPSPTPKFPAVLLTTADQLKIPLLPRGGVQTRASSKKNLQPGSFSGNPQQSGTDGPVPSPSTSILTSNSFAMLSDSDDDDNGPTQQNNDSADKARQAKLLFCSLPKAKDRPPMIQVPATLPSRVDDLLLPSKVEYFTKVTKVAVQVHAVDKTNFNKVLTIFKANNVNYFTYDCRESKMAKIVLQGLEEMSIPEVTKELEDLDITPREIKVLSKKTTATGTHVLYLLYFDKGTVKIQDLRQIKVLSGNIVNWRFFTKKPTDAAQCHRCQKFGHGSRNCNLPPRCVKCGKDHLTESCPLPRKATLDAGNAEQHKSSVKCANCSGNHTANFRGCTSRKSYIEQQEKKKKPPASSSSKPAADRSSGHPPGWSRTYARVTAAGPEPAPVQDDAADGDLFSLSEFLILARDMFQRLSSCRNKQQQFMALSELMIKYVCTV